MRFIVEDDAKVPMPSFKPAVQKGFTDDLVLLESKPEGWHGTVYKRAPQVRQSIKRMNEQRADQGLDPIPLLVENIGGHKEMCRLWRVSAAKYAEIMLGQRV